MEFKYNREALGIFAPPTPGTPVSVACPLTDKELLLEALVQFAEQVGIYILLLYIWDL